MAKLHSIETMGLVDGPGIRTVFFLSGCPLRCVFCHNPDTQSLDYGRDISVGEIVRRSLRMKPYYKNGGGVTLSGGEPLASGAFVLETIRALHKEDINVAVDTSGVGDEKYYDEIAKEADLILLDIKHYDPYFFYEITRNHQDKLIKFMESIKKTDTRVWIRHVMMPFVTDTKEDMDELVKFIRPIKANIDKIEILPYHKMGVCKYADLGKTYRIENMEAMDKNQAKDFEIYANNMLKSL
ncbi:pyruvate formate-lyase-activating protein [uncultured Anaerococcus sp.]|uniref:pyruvate formate-lyase-activating protein n=1 Tax=uncultured Anaerococcus sp. TaxID=293428 RepID=UPI00288C268F|nr:pyruvate formate-lyase-activating protein [uncultured Anaerococcus sp.]